MEVVSSIPLDKKMVHILEKYDLTQGDINKITEELMLMLLDHRLGK